MIPSLYPQWQAYFRANQPPALIVWGKNDYTFPDLNFGFFLLILRYFTLSFRLFSFEKGALALPFNEKRKNLRELSYDNKQNKPRVQVYRVDRELLIEVENTIAKVV